MAQAFSTGAALLYAGVGNGRSPVFIGTFESKPFINIDPGWQRVMNQLSGGVNAWDESFQGSAASVSGVLSRFNPAPLEAMMSRPNVAVANFAGSWNLSDVGALWQTEGYDYPVWIQYPRATLPAMAGGGLVLGYRFWSCKLVGPDRIDPSTEAYKIGVIIECKPILTTATNPMNRGAVSNAAKWWLYDHVMAGLPALN